MRLNVRTHHSRFIVWPRNPVRGTRVLAKSIGINQSQGQRPKEGHKVEILSNKPAIFMQIILITYERVSCIVTTKICVRIII